MLSPVGVSQSPDLGYVIGYSALIAPELSSAKSTCVGSSGHGGFPSSAVYVVKPNRTIDSRLDTVPVTAAWASSQRSPRIELLWSTRNMTFGMLRVGVTVTDWQLSLPPVFPVPPEPPPPSTITHRPRTLHSSVAPQPSVAVHCALHTPSWQNVPS